MYCLIKTEYFINTVNMTAIIELFWKLVTTKKKDQAKEMFYTSMFIENLELIFIVIHRQKRES